MCVLRSTKLDQEGAKNQKIKPSDITNNDKQKDKGCANQFFSSLLDHPFGIWSIATKVLTLRAASSH